MLYAFTKNVNVNSYKAFNSSYGLLIAVLVDESLIQPTSYIPLDNSDTGTLEKKEVVEVAKRNVNEGIQKGSGKKAKNETDKGKKQIMQAVSGIACLQTSTEKTWGGESSLTC